MIKNCLSAVSTVGAGALFAVGSKWRRTWTGAGCRGVANVVMALLIAGAGQSYGQISPSLGLRDACSGAGLGSNSAICRAESDSSQSKYNLLYADDAPASEGVQSPGAEAARPCQNCGAGGISDRPAGRRQEGASGGGHHSEATGAWPAHCNS